MEKNCRICRRAGQKLFLKGEKCTGPKCPFVRRSYAPGLHGTKPVRISGYGKQLREKQKIKSIFGISEKQLKNYYQKASKKLGQTSQTLLVLLETRLDNVVFRLSFAPSRPAARQMITSGYIMVNQKKVDIPSYQVKRGDKISLTPKAKKSKLIENRLKEIGKIKIPPWLKLDKKNLTGEVLKLPEKTDIELGIDESLVVEYYSR